ncbi:MAG TPA: HD domain-containing phosphohydrolase [Solirubrobacter sp.]|nr:HD domain-containing phosphohydrolase [Solirubrobacter sp.]
MRACLIATRLAEGLELDGQRCDDVYWVSLLGMVGCTADSYELHQIWGDDLALRAGMFGAGPSELSVARYFLSRAGSDGGPARRVGQGVRLLASGMRAVIESLTTHCQVTGRLAGQLRFGPGVQDPLGHMFARWDGKGVPRGVAGDEIALPARLFTVANYIEVEQRLRGADAAIEFARRHAGSVMDPEVVEALVDGRAEILAGVDEQGWEEVMGAEPGARARLVGEELDAALAAIGDFADLKSPWFSGHSGRVAESAAAAAAELGLPPAEVLRLRRAALVHAVGRAGVPNTIWDKPKELTIGERERMQLSAYYTDRILRRGSLAGLADLASASHERIDGSGYPRGLGGAALSRPARVLAAADVYDALTSARPYRGALSADQAAKIVREEARAGRLDGEAADAVLGVAGHRPPRRPSAPADLTPREVEVLRLIAIGHTTAQVAAALGISAKTTDHHIQHIYAKIGASSRSVATLFAMQHGLVDA